MSLTEHMYFIIYKFYDTMCSATITGKCDCALEGKISTSKINININISGIDPSTKELISFLLTQINKSYPEFYSENGIEGPETSGISESKFDKILGVIQEKGGKAAEKLGPIIQLIPVIKSALGM